MFDEKAVVTALTIAVCVGVPVQLFLSVVGGLWLQPWIAHKVEKRKADAARLERSETERRRNKLIASAHRAAFADARNPPGFFRRLFRPSPATIDVAALEAEEQPPQAAPVRLRKRRRH